MNAKKMNVKKTKYRYFMDNLEVFPIRPIIKYTIPVPNDPLVDESKQEFFDRNYPDVTITNIKMKHMIDKTAKALVKFGIKEGDIVTICHTNTPETFYMDYALSKIGAIPNYIYPNVTADEMKYYMNELDSKYMFILDKDSIRKNVKAATAGTGIKIISSSVVESFPKEFKAEAAKTAPKSDVFLENEVKWEEFIENGRDAKDKEVEYTPEKICAYIHTSGTSSVPKAVMMSNENVNSIPRNYEIDGIRYDAGKTAVQTIPEFVSYGITTNHLLFCNNVINLLIPEMEAKNFYDLLSKYKPEYGFSTPSHARELIKRPTDMSNTEYILFGGDGFDDVEEDMNRYIKENGGNTVAYQGYGSTEMSAVTIINAPGRHKLGSIGRLSGETQAIIIETDKEPGVYNVINEPNKIGELCLTGPGVTLGYAGNSKEEAKKVYIKHPDGKTYVHMGDFISRDEDGFFYYHGRIKNVITRKSFTFSPDEIVKAIMMHPNVKQCVVVPKYSKEEKETPSAHIVLNNYDNKEQTLNEIIDLVNQNVQEFHRPTDYKIRKEIVKTRNNKNNITALKIEDSAMLYDGVINANIMLMNDGNYDYSLSIEFNSNKLDCSKEELEQKIYNHIVKISNYIKFNVGKIKMNIKFIDLTYSDLDASKKYSNNEVYVKKV